ncbi:MAG: mevalonate kinase [Halobacteriaceae archaeon]
MVTVSAPGKVYLFGEHAVVYGEPAVPCAISRRATVTVRERDDNSLIVNAKDLSLEGFTVEYSGGINAQPDIDVSEHLVEAAMAYIETAISQVREHTNRPNAGVEVTIESNLPLGAGLGSSAAVVVSTIKGGITELGGTISDEKLAQRAYQVEHIVQDGRASRADTFCSTMGGAVRVEGDDCNQLDAPTLPFIVGYDGGSGDTRELVSMVQSLKDEYSFAAETISTIGDIVRTGESLIQTGQMNELGDLMNFNHGLLSALGVSSRTLDSMVWAAREAGADGAKLTGAGGSGCIVALDDSDQTLTALSYNPECEQAFRAELDTDGVVIES